MKVTAVIPAAGSGRRMQHDVAKQFIRIGAKPILFYTLRKFEFCNFVDDVVLVVPKDDIEFTREEVVAKFGLQKVKKIVAGGRERQASVFAGLQSFEEIPDYVIIHDGVRPFITQELIEKAILSCSRYGAVITAIPLTSTIKHVENYTVTKTVNREQLWEVQTPQGYEYRLIYSAYKKADEDGFMATDDAMMVERIGKPIMVIEGLKQNIKITTPEDLEFAKYFMESEY